MINLKDLKYLVAIADTRHFGKAAERCFVSQPTLSAQLKKLEQYLGVQLVERQPNNVKLTEIGAKVVTRSRHMLQVSDEILELARASADPLTGRLKVALIPTMMCCCWRTAIACAITRWRYAAAWIFERPRIFAPPILRP